MISSLPSPFSAVSATYIPACVFRRKCPVWVQPSLYYTLPTLCRGQHLCGAASPWCIFNVTPFIISVYMCKQWGTAPTILFRYRLITPKGIGCQFPPISDCRAGCVCSQGPSEPPCHMVPLMKECPIWTPRLAAPAAHPKTAEANAFPQSLGVTQKTATAAALPSLSRCSQPHPVFIMFHL